MTAIVEPAGRAATAKSIHSGQIVVSQAAAALWLASLGRGSIAIAAATLGAAAVLTMMWVRVNRRWLYRWLGLALRFTGRRRTVAAGADAAVLLDWLAAGSRLHAEECDGQPAGVIEDAHGRSVLLELGDPGSLVTAAPGPLPALAALAGTGIGLHLVIAGVPALSGAGAPATSYRQLTDGSLLAQQRILLGIRAIRSDGSTEDDLRRTLAGAVRRARRRLAATGVRLLSEPAAAGVLLDLLHHDGSSPAREGWTALRLGGLFQATYRLHRLEPGLVPRLLALPATSITLGLSTDRVAIRLAAPNVSALTVAGQALRRLAGSAGMVAVRQDGEHTSGLADTLPLGSDHIGESAVPVRLGGAGLLLGRDRHDQPVIVRFFRAEPTRTLLVGGPRIAQRLALRAMALGAQIVVQTARPQAWDAFVRGVAAPGEAVAVVPPGRPAPVLGRPGTPLRPQLVVVDAGPVADDVPVPPAPWRTVLAVRDELTAADVDGLARADLVILQPLTPAEAGLAASALGLGSGAEWFARIHGGMVGVVQRRTVRWALLSETPVEQQLLGTLSRG